MRQGKFEISYWRNLKEYYRGTKLFVINEKLLGLLEDC